MVDIFLARGRWRGHAAGNDDAHLLRKVEGASDFDGGSALGGEWKSDDFKIEGNQIKPIHNGNCIITYVIYDSILISRTIDVK